MARKAPGTLHLPSGRQVQVRVITPAPPVPAGSLAALDAFEQGRFTLSDLRGDAVPVAQLRVDDFQVIRAWLTAQGHLDESPVQRPCDNCQHPLEVRPCAALEFFPFLDGDLDDPDLDAPFAYGDPLPIAAVALSGGEATEVALQPVTVEQARPLFAAAASAHLRPTAALVRAMGISRLGDETHPGRIARALQRCSDESWSDLTAWVDRAFYPPRLESWVRCDECGAGAAFEAPAAKEFPPDAAPPPATDEPFPSFEAFSSLVEKHARRVFARMAVRGVGLFVEEGPAACDDGGVALLGSYEPGETEGHGVIARPPEVQLYYRTFRAMHEQDGPYDLDAEIIETLEHELEHHHAYLRGDDPQDDLERAEIADEIVGRIGATEARRRAARSARQGLGDFLYRTWPLWLLALAVACWEAWTASR